MSRSFHLDPTQRRFWRRYQRKHDRYWERPKQARERRRKGDRQLIYLAVGFFLAVICLMVTIGMVAATW